ncbi:antiterminator Q family protein [Pseudomonas huanghezhanensis]|uniref:antiterminator Q family protein n=1 Tax=Pseudomonas huanghezhanensis TaxID=3002903 RepID=UPI0022862841|nr:antiterminator Q family protein [Pseudomonas sp. BSw22131]
MTARSHVGKPLGGTEVLLEQWAIWRRVGTGSPRSLTTGPSANQPSFFITDDVALVVDGAVARLTARERQLGEMVLSYYGDGHAAKRIGDLHGMSEAKARELIRAGVGWIDCVLDHQSNPVDIREDEP